MMKEITGIIESCLIIDYYGNEREVVDLYDKPSNKDLYDLTSIFHGKKVRITIEEII
jgi:hypothetical protein